MCLCFLFLISPVFLFIPKRSSPPEGGQRQPCVRNLKICGCLDFSHSFERTKNKRAHTPVRPYGNKHQQCRGRPMCLPKRKTKEQKNKRAHAGAPIQATDNSNVGADRCVCPKERLRNKRIKGRTQRRAPTATNTSNVGGRPMCLPKGKTKEQKNKRAHTTARPFYKKQVLFYHKLSIIFNIYTVFQRSCYLAALEVVNSSVGSFFIGCNRVDACYATGYGNPACVVGKFLF